MGINTTITHFEDLTTLRLSGDLGPRSRPDLCGACISAVEQRRAHLTIDLTDVTTIDAPAIRFLENLAAEVLADGGDVMVVAPSPTLQAMLAAFPLRIDVLVLATRDEARALRHTLAAASATLSA